MILLPIYRPEITAYRRDGDGRWVECHGGTTTNTLFYPVPDEDGSGPSEVGLRRVVARGQEPFFEILAPDGAALFRHGSATFLRTPEDRSLDGFTALVFAKRRARGLELWRKGMPRPGDPGPPRRSIAVEFGPPPASGPAATRQLSLFGEGGGA